MWEKGELPAEKPQDQEEPAEATADSAWLWWWLLPLLFPILGFFLWASSTPPTPKASFSVDNTCVGIGDSLSYSVNLPAKEAWGDQLFYAWQIGDSSYEVRNPRHVFDSAGTYPIRLRLTRKRFWKQSDTTLETSQTLYTRPKLKPISFTYTQEPNRKNLRLQADSSAYTGLVYQWRIGDTLMRGRSVSYPIGQQGVLSVQLTVFWPEQEDNPTCHVQSSRTFQVGGGQKDQSPFPAPSIEPLQRPGQQVQWAPWLPWTWLAILAAMLLALRPFQRYLRRKRSLSKLKQKFQAGDQPPYTLPLPSQEHLLSPETEIYSLADALRQRKRGLSEELDIVPSIRATVAEAGLPHIRYQQLSSPTAYLVLIDKAAEQDHRARLFAMLMGVLQEEDVDIVRLYFEGDPRICYLEDEQGEIPQRLNLDSLYQPYGDRRLLIFADTEVVAHPTRARLSEWAVESLLRWEERIWLTPKPTAAWGYTDQLVYRSFILLTADLSSQLQLVETLSNEKPDYFQLRKQAREQDVPVEADLYTREGLQTYLGPELFQWVAATTVHPEPRWEVTLTIGKALDEANCFPQRHPLLSYSHLYRLAKIDWLQEGFLPEGLRRELAATLDTEVELVARTAVLALLEDVLLPEEAFARKEHEIQMAVQRSILRPRDKEAQRELLYLWEQGFLTSPVPQVIKRQKRNTILLFFLYAILALGGFAWFQNSLPPPYLASYGLASEPDSLALLNAKGVAAFQSGQFDSAFIFYEAVLGLEPQESHVLHNLELMDYNEGRILHDQGNFPLALSSYLSLSTPTIQESDESRYARGLAWAYLDSTQQAQALSDSLSSQTDSPMDQPKEYPKQPPHPYSRAASQRAKRWPNPAPDPAFR